MFEPLLKIHYMVWLVLSCLAFAFGEYLCKLFANEPKYITVIYMLGIYSLGVLLWLPAIVQRNQLSVVGTIWSILSLVCTLFVGIVLFGETVTLMVKIGICLAFISIILLTL